MATPPAVRILSTLIASRQADRSGRHAALLVTLAFCAGLAYALMGLTQGLAAILAAVVLLAAAQGPISILADGIILGAAYMLYLYRRVVFGELTREDLKSITDLNLREKLIFAPLVVLVLWMGIYPKSFLDVFAASSGPIAARYHAAKTAAESLPPGVRTAEMKREQGQ